MLAPILLNQSTRRRAVCGFTLIELLIVITVISILAALLVPSVTKSIHAAHAADSMNHLRQIVSASMFFAADHNGRFHNGWGYDVQLAEYLHKSINIRTVYTSRNADKQPIVVGSTIPITYSVHGVMMGPSTDDQNFGQRTVRMRKPSRLILVADGIQAPNNSWQANFHFQNPNAYVYGTYDAFTEAELNLPLEDNGGAKGVGPDSISANAGWFRYCNNGAVAAGFGDGHAALIPKGSVLAENLIPF